MGIRGQFGQKLEVGDPSRGREVCGRADLLLDLSRQLRHHLKVSNGGRYIQVSLIQTERLDECRMGLENGHHLL